MPETGPEAEAPVGLPRPSKSRAPSAADRGGCGGRKPGLRAGTAERKRGAGTSTSPSQSRAAGELRSRSCRARKPATAASRRPPAGGRPSRKPARVADGRVRGCRAGRSVGTTAGRAAEARASRPQAAAARRRTPAPDARRARSSGAGSREPHAAARAGAARAAAKQMLPHGGCRARRPVRPTPMRVAPSARARAGARPADPQST